MKIRHLMRFVIYVKLWVDAIRLYDKLGLDFCPCRDMKQPVDEGRRCKDTKTDPESDMEDVWVAKDSS